MNGAEKQRLTLQEYYNHVVEEAVDKGGKYLEFVEAEGNSTHFRDKLTGGFVEVEVTVTSGDEEVTSSRRCEGCIVNELNTKELRRLITRYEENKEYNNSIIFLEDIMDALSYMIHACETCGV